MIKVPFDWEVFQKDRVVIEFVHVEHIAKFVERYFPNGVPYRDGTSKSRLKIGDYRWYRFVDGVWQSQADRKTYTGYMYGSYLHMVYDFNHDVPPSYAEVGDLL